jgi:hypothetical protein
MRGVGDTVSFGFALERMELACVITGKCSKMEVSRANTVSDRGGDRTYPALDPVGVMLGLPVTYTMQVARVQTRQDGGGSLSSYLYI